MSIIEGVDGTPISTVPNPTSVQALGTQVLVETLSAQEALGTGLYVQDDTKVGAPQGYVLGVGPKVADDWGFRVGDRVIVTGNFTPVPEIKASKSERMMILVEPHQVKARLVED